MKEGADFISCQAWGKTAETMSKFLTKGSEIVVSGRIQTRTWDDNEGKKDMQQVYFAVVKKTNVSRNGDPIDNFIPVDIDSSDDLPF